MSTVAEPSSRSSSHGMSSLPPLNDALLVADWLQEITGAPLTEVRRRLAAECRLVGHNVREAARAFGLTPHIWNDRRL